MSVVTSLKDRRKEKQVMYERKMLREISIEKLRSNVFEVFEPFFPEMSQQESAIEDGCIDMAIEAFLLGAQYSRLGYYGEPLERVKQRCENQHKYLVDVLFDQFFFWTTIGDYSQIVESLYYACQYFIELWFDEGFRKGEKRYRLKLK